MRRRTYPESWRLATLQELMFRQAASRPPTQKDTPACQLPWPHQLHESHGEAVPANGPFPDIAVVCQRCQRGTCSGWLTLPCLDDVRCV